MKIFVLLIVVLVGVSANCGCLKCNPNLKSYVQPGPKCPVTIIYKDGGPDFCPEPIPYSVQVPDTPYSDSAPCSSGATYDYSVVVPPLTEQQIVEKPVAIGYQIQTPDVPSEPGCSSLPPLKLNFCTDTVVLPSAPTRRVCPQAPVYQGTPGKWVYQPGKQCNPVPSYVDVLPPVARPKCVCRYGLRKKRDIPLLTHGVNFMVGLLPPIIKNPIQQTVKMMNYHNPNKNVKKTMKNIKKQQQKLIKKIHTPKLLQDQALTKASYDFIKALDREELKRQQLLNKFLPQPNALKKTKTPLTLREKTVLLEKLKKLNSGNRRSKRSIIIGSNELSLPFFEVKDDDLENNNKVSDEDYDDYDGEENSDEESEEEIVYLPQRLSKTLEDKRKDMHNRFMDRHPLLHLMKAPIALLKQFNDIKETVDPVLKQGAELIGSSKQYFKDFHNNFQSGMLNLASNVIGDFDNVGPKPDYLHQMLKPVRRFRRSTGKPQNFRLAPQEKVRKKRYILKVVDENEVQEFLKEKLGNIIDNPKPKKHTKKVKVKEEDVLKKVLKSRDHKNGPIVGASQGKKVKVEKLKPKIIIDNNGIPFMEMNGVKRPMALTLKRKKASEEVEESIESAPANEDSSESEKTGDKLSDLIEMAKERVEQGEPILKSGHTEMPVHTIKEKITQTLSEVDDLVNMDFSKYSGIHDLLLQAQNIKISIVEDWKKILMEKKINDISCKLGLLDKFKELQTVKDDCVKSIAKVLENENRFMTKTLIIVNIRLQKLQCVISRVVDDFSERIRLNRPFSVQLEIKFVDLINSINLVHGLTRNDNLNAVMKARDACLQEEMDLLENLRKILLTRDMELITEVASVLWEMKNIEKLQKDTITDMNGRIDNGLRIKKELKIVFDLQKQWDQCYVQLKSLLTKIKGGPVLKLNKVNDDKDLSPWLKKYRKYINKKLDDV